MTQQFTLTAVDTTGIQRYIFGSNRLRENIGASHLVDTAARRWPLALLDEIGKHNVVQNDLAGYELADERRIEDVDQALQAEVIYAGGGNTLILFRDDTLAKKFAELYSRQLIERAPGLEAVIAHQPIDWGSPKGLADGTAMLLQALSAKKTVRRPSTPLLGLGITAQCASTGLPATDYDPFDLSPAVATRRYRPVSAEILAKSARATVEEAKDRLKDLIPDFKLAGFEIPDDFEEFGQAKGEISYIAVVHADGNGMGQRFEAVTQGLQDNRQTVRAMRNLSQAVERAGREAMAELGKLLVKNWDPSTKKVAKAVDADQNMPFRPLVYGGDDVTFVCEGRLGLALAVAYLSEFELAAKRRIPAMPGMGEVYACAGIAIVKTHYPFARAYALAEDLCRQAKRYVRENASAGKHPGGFSALDWHFALGGLYGPIDEIRRREYVSAAGGSLAMRPLRLDDDDLDWRTWPRFQKVVRSFQDDSAWKGKHNKVVGLRDALRGGPVAVTQYRQAYGIGRLPMLSEQHPSLQEAGWYGQTCGYFDAVEALDFYRSLE